MATAIMHALFATQLRDPRTGKPSRSKWAKGQHAAGMRDFIQAQMRALIELAHGDVHKGNAAAAGVTRLGEFFGVHVDDKSATTAPRTTIFVSSNASPSQEIPPDAGQRTLSPAEGRYEDVREEDAP